MFVPGGRSARALVDVHPNTQVPTPPVEPAASVRPIRVPGFPSPPAALAQTSALCRRAPTRALSVRLMVPLLQRYKQLLRDLEDEEFDSTLTELVHALLHAGPTTTQEARELVRRWRWMLDEA